MIFAETERLRLRALRRDELPRQVALLGVWDIVRWLSTVPFPYTLRDAEEFFSDMAPSYSCGEPQLYAVALKADDLLIGCVGLHQPRGVAFEDGEVEIGYWLGQDYWGCGFMSEAASAVVDLGFARAETRAICANTTPNNLASQAVLRKLGLRSMGYFPRDYAALRGGDTIMKWVLSRREYEAVMPLSLVAGERA
jgi:8-oxo-dGTP diphosphatase